MEGGLVPVMFLWCFGSPGGGFLLNTVVDTQSYRDECGQGCGGQHRYTVQFSGGQLSNADGVGFVFSNKCPTALAHRQGHSRLRGSLAILDFHCFSL